MSDWDGYLATLATAREAIRPLHAADPQAGAEAERLLFMALASGWYTAFADRDRPDFVPAVNTHCHLVGTNPDYIYAAASIDGAGEYLLTGERGDSLFLMLDIAAGGLGVMEQLGPSLGTVDLDSLEMNGEGRFALLLAAERPADWPGDWHPLDPAAQSLTLRQASYDWGGHREARVAIERRDSVAGGRHWSAAEIAERLAALAAFPQRIASMALGFIVGQRAKHLWNAFEHDDWAGRGGVEGQHYYQGLFRLEPGKVLLLDTALPDVVRYWNVQLNDMAWNTVDWMNHQSSLNGGQAVLDSDGHFRAVIALEDPGVANWLDPGGITEGAIMLRWTGASSGPEPRLTLVDLAELADMLPPDTLRVSAEQRDAALRARRRAVQMRRRW